MKPEESAAVTALSLHATACMQLFETADKYDADIPESALLIVQAGESIDMATAIIARHKQ